jgi:hypothetical protein
LWIVLPITEQLFLCRHFPNILKMNSFVTYVVMVHSSSFYVFLRCLIWYPIFKSNCMDHLSIPCSFSNTQASGLQDGICISLPKSRFAYIWENERKMGVPSYIFCPFRMIYEHLVHVVVIG